MRQIPATLTTLLMGVVVTIASLWIGQNHHLLPEQVSAQAPLVDRFFDLLITISAALFLIVQGALLLFIIQYRQRPGDDTDGSPIEGNIPLEIVWTAIPAIIVIGVGVYSVQVYTDMGGVETPNLSMPMAHNHFGHEGGLMGSAMAAPMLEEPMLEATADIPPDTQIAAGIGITANPRRQNEDSALVVNVQGLQYAWLFTYPDSGITTGELHVPLGQDVKLNLSAMDVIHSFWLPQFRIKQDAIPGQPTFLRFTAMKTGTYPVVCAELCGAYHGSMRTQIIVHEPEEYDAWVAENRIAATPAAANPTSQLALRSTDLGVDDHLLAQLRS